MKVSELEGALLDYWVGKALGLSVCRLIGNTDGCWLDKEEEEYLIPYSPSTDWVVGGPIIEDNAITVTPISDAEWLAEEHITLCQARGLTYLIAAMRCFVASKYGDSVPCPDKE